MERFDWRISMADVATSGPFSPFAGIDRTLAVIRGSGLVLTVGTDPPITLSTNSDPVFFLGDTPTSAQLLAGAIRDLNVMTRRGRFNHQLTKIQQATSYTFDDEESVAIIVALDGSVTVASDREFEHLNHGDASMMRRAHESNFQIDPTPESLCYLILLSKCLKK